MTLYVGSFRNKIDTLELSYGWGVTFLPREDRDKLKKPLSNPALSHKHNLTSTGFLIITYREALTIICHLHFHQL